MAERKTKRRVKVVQLVIGLVILSAFVATGWYVNSPRFKQYVRGRMIARIEEATGGRADMRSFSWNLSKLQFVAEGVTIHGREADTEVPYVNIERVYVEAKIISLLSRRIGLRDLELDRPIVHIIVYPDGSTNIPQPKTKSTGDPAQRLFDLAVERTAVRGGMLLLNDRPMPVDFTARLLEASMNYAAGQNRYDGTVRAGKIDAAFRGLRPISAVGEATFSIWPKLAKLNSLVVKSGKSQVQATATIEDFNSPKARVEYTAAVDVAELGSIVRMYELHAGRLDLQGQVIASAAEFSSNGRIAARSFAYEEPGTRVRNVSLNADYKADSDRLLLTNMAGGIFGGTFRGSAEIGNWTTRPRVPKVLRGGTQADLPAAPETGTAKLTIQDVRASEFAASIWPDSAMEQMRFAGSASGGVTVTWKYSPALATLKFDTEVTGSQTSAPGEMPVSGTVHGVYNGQTRELALSQMNLRTPATSISGSGTIGVNKGSMQVALETTNLAEFQPIVQKLSGPQGLPVDIAGRASFKGRISGRMDDPNVDGNLAVNDFDMLVKPAEGGTGSAVRRIHWDTFAGDVQYSSSQLVMRNARLKHDRSEVAFNLRASLQNGRFTQDSPFAADIVTRGASVPDLATLAGVTMPLTGAADIRIGLGGTQSDPQAHGHVQIVNGTLYGESFKSLLSDVRLAHREVRFNNIEFLHNGGTIGGTAAYNVDAKSARFNLRGKNIELASLRQLSSGRVKVTGLVDFTAEGGGTLDHPSITGTANVRNLALNGERAGNLTLNAVTKGNVLTLTGRSDFEHAAFNVDGTIRLNTPFPADLAIKFDHLDIDAFLTEYLRGRLTGHSTIAGVVNVRGPLRTPERLDINGDISQVLLQIANIQVRNEGPIRFAMAQDVVRLQQAHLVGGDTDMVATGAVELAGAGKIDMRADGHVNMKILQSFDPDVSSYGRLDMNLLVRGVLDKPVLDGQIRVTNVGIAYVDLPNGLSELNGELVFNEDRLQVQKLTGKTGGGNVTIGGFVSFGRTITFNMDAHARDVRLRYPQGVSSMADADVRLTGTPMNSLLSGDVTVKRFTLEPSFDLATFAAATKAPPTLPNPNSPITNMRLDLHVVSTPELQVQTSLARISGDADLRLRGTAPKPIVLGRISIIEGQVMFNGTKYELDRGDITFTNPAHIDPVLDMQLRTRVRDYDINIGLHGAVSRGIATTYRSDPPLPTSDVIALLAFGRTREENAQLSATNESFTQTASNAILGEALNATVSSRVQKLFGVSRIKINPEVGGAENNPGTARLTIEQQVANNVTITYITDVTRANQQIIQMEYNLSRSVSVIAVRDQNGVVGIDVRIRQRKR